MSFFFSTANKKERPKNAAPRGAVTPKMKQSASTLNRLGCKVCPLKDTGNQVEAYLPEKTTILFLGAAPTQVDVKKRKPFSNPDEKLLKELVHYSVAKRAGYGYIVKHEPQGSIRPDWQAIECCRGYMVATVEKARPRLIVGLGVDVLQQVMGTVDITGMRGRVFAVKIGDHACWFMPTYDPREMVRMAYEKERPLGHRLGFAFKLDIEKACQLSKTLSTPNFITAVEAKADINCYSGLESEHFKRLVGEFEAAKRAKEISIDFECYPLRPYAKDSEIMSCAISYMHKKEHRTFSFAIDHPKTGWTKKQKLKIWEMLEELLSVTDSEKVAHNAPFELEWLISNIGTGFLQHDNWHDTMMQAHLIDERKGPGKEEDRRPTYQSLNFLIKQHFGLAVKSLFKLNMKDMRKTDIDECLLYNGVDAKTTILLFYKQREILDRIGSLETYNFVRPRLTAIAVMQYLGLEVDQEVVKRFDKKLTKELEEASKKIHELKVIKKYVKDHGFFNPLATEDVLAVFRDYLKRPEVNVLKDNAKSADDTKGSVDKNVLSKIDHPLSPLIITYRNRTKLKSTYVDEMLLPNGKTIHWDSKLHTSFNSTFTETGRLSSDDPNLQNFPKREDAWIREEVKPSDDEVLIALDYGQLEWCLACCCCKDKVMVKSTWDGYDVHMAWAVKIAKRWPELIGGKKYLGDSGKMKIARSLVKNKMVFPAIFGATENSIAGYLNMPPEVAAEIFKEFWSTFTGLASWQKAVMKNFYEKGYVESLFGRRRYAPLNRNMAINHPIQGTASEIVVTAMTSLSKHALETGKMYLHPRINIHDDLTFVVPNKSSVIEETIETAVKHMLELPYDFINVPMAVEASIGPDWANMEEIGKFWTTELK